MAFNEEEFLNTLSLPDEEEQKALDASFDEDAFLNSLGLPGGSVDSERDPNLPEGFPPLSEIATDATTRFKEGTQNIRKFVGNTAIATKRYTDLVADQFIPEPITELGDAFTQGLANRLATMTDPDIIGRTGGVRFTESDSFPKQVAEGLGDAAAQIGVVTGAMLAGGPLGLSYKVSGAGMQALSGIQAIRRQAFALEEETKSRFAEQGRIASQEDLTTVTRRALPSLFAGQTIDSIFGYLGGKVFSAPLRGVTSKAVNSKAAEYLTERFGRAYNVLKEAAVGGGLEAGSEMIEGMGSRAAVESVVNDTSFGEEYKNQLTSPDTFQEGLIGGTVGALTLGAGEIIATSPSQAARISPDVTDTVREIKSNRDIAPDEDIDMGQQPPVRANELKNVSEGLRLVEQIEQEGIPQDPAAAKATFLTRAVSELDNPESEADTAIIPESVATPQQIQRIYGNEPHLRIEELENGDTQISRLPGVEHPVQRYFRSEQENLRRLQREQAELLRAQELREDQIDSIERQLVNSNRQVRDLERAIAREREPEQLAQLREQHDQALEQSRALETQREQLLDPTLNERIDNRTSFLQEEIEAIQEVLGSSKDLDTLRQAPRNVRRVPRLERQRQIMQQAIDRDQLEEAALRDRLERLEAAQRQAEEQLEADPNNEDLYNTILDTQREAEAIRQALQDPARRRAKEDAQQDLSRIQSRLEQAQKDLAEIENLDQFLETTRERGLDTRDDVFRRQIKSEKDLDKRYQKELQRREELETDLTELDQLEQQINDDVQLLQEQLRTKEEVDLETPPTTTPTGEPSPEVEGQATDTARRSSEELREEIAGLQDEARTIQRQREGLQTELTRINRFTDAIDARRQQTDAPRTPELRPSPVDMIKEGATAEDLASIPTRPEAEFERAMSLSFANRIREIAKNQSRQRFTSWLKRKFLPRRGLSEEVFFTIVQKDGDIAAIEREAGYAIENFIKQINNLPEITTSAKKYLKENQEVINDALGGNESALSSLPDELQPHIRSWRTHVDTLSRAFIDEGIAEGPLQATFEANEGIYINRAYDIFEKPGHVKEVMQDIPLMRRLYAYFRQQFPISEMDIEGLSKISNPKIESLREQRQKILDAADKERTGLSTEQARQIGSIDQDILARQYHSRIESMAHSFLISSEAAGSPVQALMHAYNVNSRLKKDLGILKKRGQIDPVVREVWGEVTDAPRNYVNTVHKQAVFLAKHRALSRITDIGLKEGFLSRTPDIERGITAPMVNPDSPLRSVHNDYRLSPLANLYTTPDFRNAFDEAFGTTHNAFLNWVIAPSLVAKWSSTVANPSTHGRNFLGNLSFMVANGNFSLNGFQALNEATGAFADIFSFTRTESVKQNMVKYTKLNLMTGLDAQLYADMYSDVRASPTMRRFTETRLARYVKTPVEKLSQLYQAEDTFWKILAFHAELSKLQRRESNQGKSIAELEEQAARIVMDTMPTYKFVPPALQVINKAPLIGPFISFHAEVLRNSVNTAKIARREIKSGDPNARADGYKRLAGLLIASSMYSVAAEMIRRLAGFSDEEMLALRVSEAPWNQNGSLAPYKRDEEGNPVFVNFDGINAYQGYTGALLSLVFREDLSYQERLLNSLGELLQPFIAEDLWGRQLIDWSRNTIEGTTRKVYNENDDLSSQTKDVITHMLEPLKPGALEWLERMHSAMTGTPDRKGNVRDVGEEVLATAGPRVTTHDRKNTLFFKGRKYQNSMREAKTELNRLLRVRGPLEDSEIAEAFDRFNRIKRRADQDMLNQIEAKRVQGLSDYEIMQKLDEAGLSKTDVDFLIRKQIPLEQLSDSVMDDMIDDAPKDRMEQVRRVLGRPVAAPIVYPSSGTTVFDNAR